MSLTAEYATPSAADSLFSAAEVGTWQGHPTSGRLQVGGHAVPTYSAETP